METVEVTLTSVDGAALERIMRQWGEADKAAAISRLIMEKEVDLIIELAKKLGETWS